MRVSAKTNIEEVMEFLTRDFLADQKAGYCSRVKQLIPDCKDLKKVEQEWQVFVLRDAITRRKEAYDKETARDKEMLGKVRKKFTPTVKDGFFPYYLFPYEGPPYDHIFGGEDHRKLMNNVIYKRWADYLLELLRENQ